MLIQTRFNRVRGRRAAIGANTTVSSATVPSSTLADGPAAVTAGLRG
jgi:hypothetical protein